MPDESERHWHEVLVVEDEFHVRDAISTLLDFQAFTVRTAKDGTQAVAHLLDGYRPCLILLDLSMPGMDGEAFRAEQHKLPECRDVPVVIVSARVNGHEVAQSLGAREFLSKPVGVANLLATVERHCRFAE